MSILPNATNHHPTIIRKTKTEVKTRHTPSLLLPQKPPPFSKNSYHSPPNEIYKYS